MTTDPIIESNMIFGPYDDGCCFYIEKSKTYEVIQEGVQIAEFLLIRSNEGHPANLWVVEAKSSSPQPNNLPKFEIFIDEIREKLTNALTLCIAMCLGRHSNTECELPEPFRNLNLSTTNFRLILVINGHKEAWLPPLQDELKKVLRSTVKTWALSPTSVSVINHTMAQQEGLINL